MHSLNYLLARLLAKLDATARTYTASDVMSSITVHRNSPMKSTELDCNSLTKVKEASGFCLHNIHSFVRLTYPFACKRVTPHPVVFEFVSTSK